MIFVQIASYRDPELIPTVLDLFEKSAYPAQLRVVVAWQHDDYESITPIKHLIEYIDIPYTDSKGVCWARNLIQQRYNGEEYTLHLDSHHRFIKNWDLELYKMYDSCKKIGSELPMITGYLPKFDPNDNTFCDEVWKMKLDGFMVNGPLFFVHEPINNSKVLKTPIPTKFYSGHFAFTDGNFCNLVKHDPDYYFFGEETNISVRAFTHGYDLYHPNKIIAWHNYNRNNRPTHWSDNTNISSCKWSLLDIKSNNKHKKLFGMDGESLSYINNEYGFGNIRSLKEYEDSIGISFKDRFYIVK